MKDAEKKRRDVRLAKRAFHHWWPPKHKTVIGFNPNRGPKKFVTIVPVSYSNPLVKLEIPRGFQTDLASVPRFLWSIPGFSPMDVNARAALVHDVIYQQQQVDREIADALFLSIMRADGVSLPVRTLMYLAVRAFGGSAWAANAEGSE